MFHLLWFDCGGLVDDPLEARMKFFNFVVCESNCKRTLSFITVALGTLVNNCLLFHLKFFFLFFRNFC